jgi:hypothetical protein
MQKKKILDAILLNLNLMLLHSTWAIQHKPEASALPVLSRLAKKNISPWCRLPHHATALWPWFFATWRRRN